MLTRWRSWFWISQSESDLGTRIWIFLIITIHLLQLLSNFSSQIGFVIIKIKFEIREIVFWHFWIASLNLKRFHAFLNNWMSTVSCVPPKFLQIFQNFNFDMKIFTHIFSHCDSEKVSYVDMLRMTYRAWFDRFAINMRWCVSLFCNVRFFSFRTDSRILLWYRTIYTKFVQFSMNTRIGIRNAIFVNLGINDEDVRSLILK